MTPSARYAAAIGVLESILKGDSAEKTLTNWARSNRYAGSKDRAAVRDIVFDCLRNFRRYPSISGINSARGMIAGRCAFLKIDVETVFTGEGYGPVQLNSEELNLLQKKRNLSAVEKSNVPDWLYSELLLEYGDETDNVCEELNHRAPIDLRVNLTKCSIEIAQELLEADAILAETVPGVSTALRVTQNPRRVSQSKAYLSGYVELQDAASQMIVNNIELKNGAYVLDYCAGGGGKTLAMASKQSNAKFHAWDVNQSRLQPLKERANRAGARVKLLSKSPTNVYDTVLVDAPCSGSGAWRRNPEGKMRITQNDLDSLVDTQISVLESASLRVKKSGDLIYATCSIFNRENIEIVNKFVQNNSTFTVERTWHHRVGQPGDGFFAAHLKKQL